MEDEKLEEKIIGAEQLDEESLNNTAGAVSQLPLGLGPNTEAQTGGKNIPGHNENIFNRK